MASYDKIRNKKLQYGTNREASNVSALLSGEYLTDDKILPSNQRQIIEQAKFADSPLGKAF